MEIAPPKLTRRAIQILGLTILGLILLSMIYYLRSIFNPVLLALLLAYILNPVANALERMKINRTITIFLIYIILTALLVLLFIIIIPLIGAQINTLYEKTFLGDQFEDAIPPPHTDTAQKTNPEATQTTHTDAVQKTNADAAQKTNILENSKRKLSRDLNGNGKYDPSYFSVMLGWVQKKIQKLIHRYPQLKTELQSLLNQLKEQKGEIAQALFEISKATLLTTLKTLLDVFSILSYLILLPLYTFFLLRGLNKIWETAQSYFPPNRKEEIVRILYRIHRAISAFFRGKLIICIIKGILTWACLEIMGIRYSLIFGGIQSIASIIPFLVLLIGMLPNLVICIFEIGMSWPYLIGILFVYAAMECLEGFVLTPWIMGKETGLHPLTVILALLIGGKLLGLFGLLIAIPLATTLKILGQEIILPHLKEVLVGSSQTGEN